MCADVCPPKSIFFGLFFAPLCLKCLLVVCAVVQKLDRKRLGWLFFILLSTANSEQLLAVDGSSTQHLSEYLFRDTQKPDVKGAEKAVGQSKQEVEKQAKDAEKTLAQNIIEAEKQRKASEKEAKARAAQAKKEQKEAYRIQKKEIRKKRKELDQQIKALRKAGALSLKEQKARQKALKHAQKAHGYSQQLDALDLAVGGSVLGSYTGSSSAGSSVSAHSAPTHAPLTAANVAAHSEMSPVEKVENWDASSVRPEDSVSQVGAHASEEGTYPGDRTVSEHHAYAQQHAGSQVQVVTTPQQAQQKDLSVALPTVSGASSESFPPPLSSAATKSSEAASSTVSVKSRVSELEKKKP